MLYFLKGLKLQEEFGHSYEEGLTKIYVNTIEIDLYVSLHGNRMEEWK